MKKCKNCSRMEKWLDEEIAHIDKRSQDLTDQQNRTLVYGALLSNARRVLVSGVQKAGMGEGEE